VDADAAAREREIAQVVAAGATRPRPSRALVAVAAAVSIVCLGALGHGWWCAPPAGGREAGASGGPGAAEGATRRSLKLPTGTAVAEPGAALRWAGARISQDAGEVFYRLVGGVVTTVTTPRAVIEAGQEACVRVTVGPSADEILVEQGTVTVGGAAVEAGRRVVRQGRQGEPPTRP
jgi:hypothetical protein